MPSHAPTGSSHCCTQVHPHNSLASDAAAARPPIHASRDTPPLLPSAHSKPAAACRRHHHHSLNHQMSGSRRAGSLLSKAWQNLKGLFSKEVLVGSDGNGNTYYRWVEKDFAGEMVERRKVKVQGGDFLYDPKIIPPQWRAWLAKTRQEPPSADEMARAAERAAVMQQRVSAIEEREQQRRIRMESLGKQDSTAGGPDMGAFMSQLENKGYGNAQQQQQQQQQTPPHAAGDGSSAGKG